MRSAVSDLGNPSFDVRSTKSLLKARTALINLEGLDKINTESGAFNRFSTAVDEFLEDHLSRSIRRPGNPEMVRPGEEAQVDLGELFTELKDLHEDTLDRLYALAVGIPNFLSSPLSTILGLSTAARVRSDIEEIITSLEEDPSSQSARDMATRVISDRASIQVIGTFPDIYEPVVSTVDSLPKGHVVEGITDEAQATKTSGVGPFVLPAAAAMTVVVNGTSVGSLLIPQTTLDLQNRAFIVSESLTTPAVYPITVPAYTYLFLTIDRSTGVQDSYRINLNNTAAPVNLTFAQTLVIVNAGLSGVGGAVEYISPGSGRMLIWALAAGPGYTRDKITVALTHAEPSLSTVGAQAVYSQTAHALLGFSPGQFGTRGSTPTINIAEAIDRLFSTLVDSVRNPDDSLTITSIATSIGTEMTITAPAVLGIAGVTKAESSLMRFHGTVNGVANVDPVPASGLVDIGDMVVGPTGESQVQEFQGDKLVLMTPLPTFDGDVVVTSALAKSIQYLDSILQPFVDVWLKNRYSQNLTFLDSAISVLGGNATPAQRNNVIRILDDLKTRLESLLVVLEDPAAVLPSNCATREREVINGIVAILVERKYDRALSLMLKCKIQEFLSLTSETSSFGGALMKTMADVAQNDIVFPNAVRDEEDGPKGTTDGIGGV
jgi:hypothetical protein